MQEKLGRLQPAAIQKPGGCEHAGELGDSQESSHCQSGPQTVSLLRVGRVRTGQSRRSYAGQRGPMVWGPSTAQTRRSPNLA